MAGKTALKEKKASLVKQHGGSPTETGTPEVQVALLTHRINHLNSHLGTHAMDFHSKRGLLKMVGQRKRLLSYLKSQSETRYNKLIRTLDLRK